MNWTVPTGFGLFLIGAGAALAQLWLRVWDPETFVKVMITLGVLLAVVVAWRLVQRERKDPRSQQARVTGPPGRTLQRAQKISTPQRSAAFGLQLICKGKRLLTYALVGCLRYGRLGPCAGAET